MRRRRRRCSTISSGGRGCCAKGAKRIGVDDRRGRGPRPRTRPRPRPATLAPRPTFGDPSAVLALLAAAPVLFLFWALAVRHWRGHAAAAGALLSALHGFAFGLWPVAGIVGGAVLLYELVAATGELDVVKAALGSVTSDRRLQALLVAMGLGALLEGAAGFGTPVAIAGAMLAALGFPPVLAAAVALLANTAGVGFGALGIGMEVAGRVSGLDPAAVSALAMAMPALGATRREVRLVIRRAFPALARPVLTISLVLAFAFLMKASGMAVALGGEIGRASC